MKKYIRKPLTVDKNTPPKLAKMLLNMIPYSSMDRWYEPFRGNGAFYDLMPQPKDWAEIKFGRDFFSYLPFDGTCENIVTNPPFRMYINGKWTNGFIPILERSMDIAKKRIGFLISHKVFNSLTPVRLEKYYKKNWIIEKIHVVSVKKWFGRYYFIIFSHNSYNTKSIISWSVENWGD